MIVLLVEELDIKLCSNWHVAKFAFPSTILCSNSQFLSIFALSKRHVHSEAKKYAFKCHRVGNTVFPVNALAFHPVHGTFATGGCDGFVNIWDAKNKKRLCQLPSFPTSVAAVDFNHNGTLLAVAASYTFEEGEKDHPADQIYIRAVSEADVKPKPRQPH